VKLILKDDKGKIVGEAQTSPEEIAIGRIKPSAAQAILKSIELKSGWAKTERG
jgi:hypothetical protein